jgi:hypothetical protein
MVSLEQILVPAHSAERDSAGGAPGGAPGGTAVSASAHRVVVGMHMASSSAFDRYVLSTLAR